jgi:hypothetical protein
MFCPDPGQSIPASRYETINFPDRKTNHGALYCTLTIWPGLTVTTALALPACLMNMYGKYVNTWCCPGRVGTNTGVFQEAGKSEPFTPMCGLKKFKMNNSGMNVALMEIPVVLSIPG